MNDLRRGQLLICVYILMASSSALGQTPTPAATHTPAPARTDVRRVLVIGDSQAENLRGGNVGSSQYDKRSYRYAFDMIGHLDKIHESRTDADAVLLARGGSRADKWSQAGQNYLTCAGCLDLIEQALEDWPTADHVILSVGGNDFFGTGGAPAGYRWHVDYLLTPTPTPPAMGTPPPGKEALFFLEIQEDIETVISFIKAERPGIKIDIVGYPYFNFTGDSIDVIRPTASPYASPTPLATGQPTPTATPTATMSPTATPPTGASPTASPMPTNTPLSRGVWDMIGQPTVRQMNDAQARFERFRANYASGDGDVRFVNSMGLTQYIYGDDRTQGGVDHYAPYGDYDPATVSFPGQEIDPTPFYPFQAGDPDFPGPPEARAWTGGPYWEILKDGLHLSNPPGYKDLAVFHTNLYFADRFRGTPDMTFYSQGGTKDGTIRPTATPLASSGNDHDLVIGHETAATYDLHSMILSFDTSDIPDNAVLTAASIYVTRQGLTDSESGNERNPFIHDIQPDGAVHIDMGDVLLGISSPYFGSSADVESGDDAASADAAVWTRFVGTARENGFRLRIDLPSSFLSEVALTGTTQIRASLEKIAASGAKHTVSFFDGDAESGDPLAAPHTVRPWIDVFYILPTATPSATTTPTPTPSPNATMTPTPSWYCCPGDADNSGSFVDANDFIAVQNNFGLDNGYGGLGDGNCSGSFVDANDFIAVQANFGNPCDVPPTATPTVSPTNTATPSPTGGGFAPGPPPASPTPEPSQTPSPSPTPDRRIVAEATPGAGVPVLRFSPDIGIGTVGSSISRTVTLDTNGLDVSLVNAFINYDTERLEFTGGSLNGAWDNTELNVAPKEVIAGVIALCASRGSGIYVDSVSGTGIAVATLEFDVIGHGPALLDHETHPYFGPRTFMFDGDFKTIQVVAPMAGLVVGVGSPATVSDAANVVDIIPDAAFDESPATRRATFHSMLEEIAAYISASDPDSALKLIEGEFLIRADGCSSGDPGDDWVTDCTAQSWLVTVMSSIASGL